jgi:hypothetical protein
MMPMKKIEEQDQDDGQLEEVPARHLRLLDRVAVDVVERLQLVGDVRSSVIEAQARTAAPSSTSGATSSATSKNKIAVTSPDWMADMRCPRLEAGGVG